ncbi:MAG: ParB N-terminal domain-containing protein [Caldisericia bacterium]|nr:ParB N-terminal domain-containing protein [Caldisericia bacterium]
MKTKNVEIAKIIKRKDRPRKINQKKVDGIIKRIAEEGQLEPIVITSYNEIISGAHRYEANKQMGELFISAYVLEFNKNSIDICLTEESLEIARDYILKTDKMDIYDTIRRLSKEQRKKGINLPNTVGMSHKEVDDLRMERRQIDSIRAGFRNKTSADRTRRVVNKGIHELQDAFNLNLITEASAYKLGRSLKEEQRELLPTIISGEVVPEISSSGSEVHKNKILKIQEQDKYGAYVETKCYTSDPEQTAKSIAKQFGVLRKDAFRALIIEMVRQLKMMNTGKIVYPEPDTYKQFSYGLRKVSDGDFNEITALWESGTVSKILIQQEYDIGRQVIDNIVDIYEQEKKKGI